VNAGDRLAEDREDQRICAVDTWRLEIVGGGIRRNAFEQQLTEVCVLALVAIERDVEQPEPDPCGPEDDEDHHQPDPGAGLHG
jgi:hypothetical protein